MDEKRLVDRRTFVGGAALAVASALAGCGGSGATRAPAGTSVDPTRQVTIALSSENEPSAGFDP